MREKQKAVKRSLVTANFSTVLSIALVLFVVSGIVLFSFHALQFSDQMKEDVSFTVYMTDDATEEQVIKLTEEIRKDNIVKSASYISKTESVKIMDKLMGEGHLDVLDGYNPYQASIEVHLKAGSFSVKQINQFIRTQESKSIVESVDYRDDLINNINSDIYDASVFFVVILIALLIISVTLINHTINLTISNKKLLIRSMQLVGANASFVRRPFLLKGLWLGFFGGLLSDIFPVPL